MALQNIILHAIAGQQELKFQFLASDLYARLKTLVSTTTEETNVRPDYSISVWYVDGPHGTKEALGIFVHTPGGRQVKFFAEDIDPTDAFDSKYANITRIIKVRQQY